MEKNQNPNTRPCQGSSPEPISLPNRTPHQPSLLLLSPTDGRAHPLLLPLFPSLSRSATIAATAGPPPPRQPLPLPRPRLDRVPDRSRLSPEHPLAVTLPPTAVRHGRPLCSLIRTHAQSDSKVEENTIFY
jgi:hypothetical protein